MSEVEESTAPLPVKEKPSGRGLLLAGSVLTIAYLVFIAAYWWQSPDAVLALRPNELGDFLAGVFAPLAFLWLVLGFIQQGHELRHSAEALWLQGMELQNSVEQQRQLVEVTREQLAFEGEMLREQRDEIIRNSQPLIKLVQAGSTGGVGDGVRQYRFFVVNHGKRCTDIVVIRDHQAKLLTKDALESGQRIEFAQVLPIAKVEPFTITVHYVDERLQHGNKIFAITGEDSKFQIEEVNVERDYSVQRIG